MQRNNITSTPAWWAAPFPHTKGVLFRTMCLDLAPRMMGGGGAFCGHAAVARAARLALADPLWLPGRRRERAARQVWHRDVAVRRRADREGRVRTFAVLIHDRPATTRICELAPHSEPDLAMALPRSGTVGVLRGG
eukprot:COSAG01_NODE_1544_length_9968_cov_20.144594_5_plen_136_part_00